MTINDWEEDKSGSWIFGTKYGVRYVNKKTGVNLSIVKSYLFDNKWLVYRNDNVIKESKTKWSNKNYVNFN